MSNEDTTKDDPKFDTGDSTFAYIIRGIASGLEVLRSMEADAAARKERAPTTEVVLKRLARIAKAIDAVREDQMRLRIQLNRVELALLSHVGPLKTTAATPQESQDEPTPKRTKHAKHAKRGRKASKKGRLIDHSMMDDVVILPVYGSEGADTARRKQQGYRGDLP